LTAMSGNVRQLANHGPSFSVSSANAAYPVKASGG
jgi:hypothetical protein